MSPRGRSRSPRSSSDNDSEPSSKTKQRFDERESQERQNTFSVEDRRRVKPSGPKPERLKFESNNDIGRNTRNQRRRGKQNNSGSDSEGQEENGNILRSNREEEEEESAISEARLHLNSAARNSRSGTREYEEEDNATCRSVTREEKISRAGGADAMDKLAESKREYAVSDRDFIPKNRHRHEYKYRVALNICGF
ncbi:hypothetical protein OS493_032251 [Desmophyllum pertusum]|uniref:Uncharacterized protein n=1 Tax=Desmophyllum pertusum TaxID=174260 RepID=A0A9W9ZJG7_9CNID|nr:hypothetical protein OS493_032251 [Desmophyllum pertusum]